jgi:hypothetical protein
VKGCNGRKWGKIMPRTVNTSPEGKIINTVLRFWGEGRGRGDDVQRIKLKSANERREGGGEIEWGNGLLL